MNILQRRWIVGIIGLVIGVIIVGGIIFLRHDGTPFFSSSTSNNDAAQNDTSTANMTTTVTNIASIPISPTSPSAAPLPSKPAPYPSTPTFPGRVITIDLVTPITNNAWTIGGSNPIVWDNPADITGEIDLVDANTKAFIGVILSETGPNQTSYNWDGRSVYLGRYSADKKDVVPGTYSIRIHFDGNNLGDLVSGPITISN